MLTHNVWDSSACVPLNIMGSFAKKVRFIIVRGIFSIISDTDFK